MSWVTPPELVGYNYSVDQARTAANQGRLLTLRLETSNICNLKCIYCNGASGKKKNDEIPFGMLKKAVAEVKSLGGKSVIVIGGGEPTIYPYFKELIRYIAKQEMIPVVITNSSTLTLKLAEFLYATGASVLFKLDSLHKEIQDRLAGKVGAYDQIKRGMDNLFSVGFNNSKNGKLRCGASFVVTKYNYQEIPLLWGFCRDNNIYPNLEEFITRGRGIGYENQLRVSQANLKVLKQKLLRIDRAYYGYDWLVYTPLPGHGCLQHLYSVYLSCNGYIRPCADIDIKLFNFKKMRIKEIIRTPFFNFIRDIENHLKGKCFRCKHNNICVGCRGNAFSLGIREGQDIYKALCREDPNCWNKIRK